MPGLPGGDAELALVHRLRHDRGPAGGPRLHEPHSFNVAWLRATPGEGVLRHRHHETQVVTVKSGRWRVTLNEGPRPSPSSWAGSTCCRSRPGAGGSSSCSEAGDDAATEGTGELLVVNGGDGRVRLEWAPEVIEAAFDAGWMLDPNGYLAPVAVMVTATEDD